MFAGSAQPHLFALPPGADFATALVAGLLARLEGRPPEALARVEIIVNTERTRRRLVSVLSQGPARLLPKILTLTDLPDLDWSLPPPVPKLRRVLDLSRLVAALLAAGAAPVPRTRAFELAASLADLLGEMQGEGIAPEALAGLDLPDIGGHWQQSLTFLSILSDYLRRTGSLAEDAEARLNAAVDGRIARWHAAPPGHPVIVAGSTGSRGPARRLIAAVAGLAQGAAVLPGLDPFLPRAVWDLLGEDEADHPQAMLAATCRDAGIHPSDVPPWHPAAIAGGAARARLLSLALRPAPVTDQWMAEAPALAPSAGDAMLGLTVVEARSQREEAGVIALRLRKAVADGQSAALVTPDRQLARRVAAQLARWGILPDDSSGRPLALVPPGVFLREVAAMIGAPLRAAGLLSLLKHPLTASGGGALLTRGQHLHLTGRLELGLLCGGPPEIGWDRLAVWAAESAGDAPVWVDWLGSVLRPLAGRGEGTLADLVARHRRAAERLAAGPVNSDTGQPETGQRDSGALWQRRAGEAALKAMDALAAAADAAGPVDVASYRVLLAQVFQAENVEEDPALTHPGIAIWGTLEARVQAAEVMILGGMNEGTWPSLPPPDPWLNRRLRRAAGLRLPERTVGLSAHDFQQAALAGEVMITRAVRDVQAHTVASRWLLRLSSLLGGQGEAGRSAWAGALERGRVWCDRAAQMDRPVAAVPPARRPAPQPPVEHRPQALSVTRIERLIRDPYAIYAEYILRLRVPDPVGRMADARDRGMFLHEVMRHLSHATRDGWPDAPGPLLDAAMAAAQQDVAFPVESRLWLGRLQAVRDWLLATEADLRARGNPAALELAGERVVDGLAHPFTLRARADRIDLGPGGAISVYDYKSGAMPTAKQVRAFAVQLPLEAAMASAGSFPGIPAGPVARVAQIHLGGGGGILDIDCTPEALDTDWASLRALVEAYQRRGQGYAARSRVFLLSGAGDYDHLSRRGEWDDSDPVAPEEVG
jgi:double-strand break repair protein AddB